MFARLTKMCLVVALLMVVQEKYANADNPVSSSAPEITAPETVYEPQDKLLVEVFPGVDIEAPNVSSVPFFEAELDISPVGKLLVKERFFLIVTEGDKDNKFVRRINKFVKTPVKDVNITPEIISAYHNDSIVPYNVNPGLVYTDITFGSAKEKLEPGLHSFALTYAVDNVMQNINGYKLFAWDVTGTGWTIPLLHTSLSVKHPLSIVPTGQSIFFEGVVDQKIANHSDKGDGTSYNFLKNDMINPGRSLILVESFGKDAFTALDNNKIYHNWFNFNTFAIITALAFGMILIYYMVSWFTISKENRKILNPSIGNLNEKFFSPAALRLFMKSNIDAKTLSVLLIRLASKGLIKIEEAKDGTFILVRQAAHKDKSGLAAGERVFLASLFPKGTLTRPLDKPLGIKITNRRRMFELPLLNEFNSQYLKANYPYFVFGIVVIIAAVIANMFVSDNPVLMMIMMAAVLLSAFFNVSASVLLGSVLKQKRGGKKWLKVLAAFVLFVILSVTTVYASIMLSVFTGVLTPILLVLMALVVVMAYTLFKQERKLGKVLAESTKLYMNYLSLGSEIPASANAKIYDLYNRHMPYALAVDLDEAWGKRFASMFTSLGKDDFSWYHGQSEINASFISELSKRLCAALEENVTFLNPNLQKFK